MSAAARMIGRVIIRRIPEAVDHDQHLRIEQAEFRGCRSTSEHIFVLRYVPE